MRAALGRPPSRRGRGVCDVDRRPQIVTLVTRREAVPGRLQRGAAVVADLVALAGIAFCIPFVFLAIAIPIALCASLVSWLIEKL